MTEWRDIPDCPYYQVSDDGRVRSLERWVNCNGARVYVRARELTPWLAVGYPTIHIVRKTRYLHRIVATVFIPNPLELPEVNHKDGIKTNCHKDNLEWVTRRQNVLHAFDNHLIPRGELRVSSKLTSLDVLDIRSDSRSYSTLSKVYGVSVATICDIRKRRTWKHL